MLTGRTGARAALLAAAVLAAPMTGAHASLAVVDDPDRLPPDPADLVKRAPAAPEPPVQLVKSRRRKRVAADAGKLARAAARSGLPSSMPTGWTRDPVTGKRTGRMDAPTVGEVQARQKAAAKRKRAAARASKRRNRGA
jgi:hypothetical protein